MLFVYEFLVGCAEQHVLLLLYRQTISFKIIRFISFNELIDSTNALCRAPPITHCRAPTYIR